MRILASIISLLFLYLPAEARMAPRMYSIMGQVSGTISEGTDSSSNPTYNNKVSLELLYLVRGGPTFGGRYLIEARNELEANSGQAYGPTAGYYAEQGWFFLVTYDVLAKLGRWTNGEGFELNLGYVEHMGDQVHVGVKYSTRQIKYKTDITNNTAIEKSIRENFPSLVLMYLF
jgi:hypothetical protein